MIYDAAIDVIKLLMACWPSMQSMTDDAAQVWVNDLESYELDVALTAVKALHRDRSFPPTWADFVGAARAVNRSREPIHRAAIEGPWGDRQVNAERMRRLRATIKSVSEHTCHKRPTATTRGDEDCPVCNKHDHSHGADKCPRCRSLGEWVFSGDSGVAS